MLNTVLVLVSRKRHGRGRKDSKEEFRRRERKGKKKKKAIYVGQQLKEREEFGFKTTDLGNWRRTQNRNPDTPRRLTP